MPSEAIKPILDRANGFRVGAEASLAQAETIGNSIVEIEKTLPIKQARQQTAPLIEAREQALRHVLEQAESALDTLSIAPSSVSSISVTEREPDVVQAEAPGTPTILSGPIEDGDVEDLPVDEEPLQDAPQLAPATEIGRTIRDGERDIPSDPLQVEVAERLDTLFRLGEYGLAFHLREAAASIIPHLEDVYSATELRLASAVGRTVGLSSQDLQSLSELRSGALEIAETLSHRSDDHSIARLSLLVAGAIPSALLRPEDASAFYLLEKVAGLNGFDQYRRLASTADENRKLGFPLTPANLKAAAHSRESTFVADSVAVIKETISDFKSSKFRFLLGERVRSALT